MAQVPLFYNESTQVFFFTSVSQLSEQEVVALYVFVLHFPKQKAVNLRRQEEMIKCHILGLHRNHRDLLQQWEHPVLPRTEKHPWDTAEQLQHTPGASLPPAASSFFPCLYTGAPWSCRNPPTHREDFGCQELLTQVLLPSLAGRDLLSSTKSCPQLPPGPPQVITLSKQSNKILGSSTQVNAVMFINEEL